MTQQAQELSIAHKGMIEANICMFCDVQDYVLGREYVTTKHLRRVFGISGTLAGVMLMALDYEKWSRGCSVTYRKRGR